MHKEYILAYRETMIGTFIESGHEMVKNNYCKQKTLVSGNRLYTKVFLKTVIVAALFMSTTEKFILTHLFSELPRYLLLFTINWKNWTESRLLRSVRWYLLAAYKS